MWDIKLGLKYLLRKSILLQGYLEGVNENCHEVPLGIEIIIEIQKEIKDISQQLDNIKLNNPVD